MPRILAIGDCNTLGTGELTKNTYAERFARHLGAAITNLGTTMATTREGVRLLRDHLSGHDIVLIQFGLVDSWRTFKYAPYVLYYPDHFLRKIGRKLVKKYKSIARKLGLTEKLGLAHVVPPTEFEANIRSMIESARPARVYLIEAAPHIEDARMPYLRQYNAVLAKLADEFEHAVLVRCFDELAVNLPSHFADETHLNEAGFEIVTRALIAAHAEAGRVRSLNVEPRDDHAAPHDA